MTMNEKKGDARSEPGTFGCKTTPFIIKNSSEENMGDGRKRTWLRSLALQEQYKMPLTGGRTYQTYVSNIKVMLFNLA